jgi:hypothetical protein
LLSACRIPARISQVEQANMIDTGISTDQDDGALPLDSQCDQRSDPRVTLLIRNAKIVYPGAEFLCVIRDVSATGVRIKVFHPLPTQMPLHIELATGECHKVTTVWARDSEAGLQFTEPQDVKRLIQEHGPFAKRALRIGLAYPAVVRSLGEACEATILNLSQFGARLECGKRFAMDQRLTLTEPSLPEISAKVRWRKDGQYGLSFQQVFGIKELALLVAGIQSAERGMTTRTEQNLRMRES